MSDLDLALGRHRRWWSMLPEAWRNRQCPIRRGAIAATTAAICKRLPRKMLRGGAAEEPFTGAVEGASPELDI
jgi:hypothetical protein